MNFRSFNDLNDTIRKNLDKLPFRPDLVVGIPRSGMLPANLISLYINCNLSDIDSFLEGKIFNSGFRHRNLANNNNQKTKVLIVDDSVQTGKAIADVKKRIKVLDISDIFDIQYCAIYAHNLSIDKVDFYFEICPLPRVFEWNIFHSNILEKSCVDIDGVLCRDPEDWENDDSDNYVNFITNVSPLFIPKVKIGALATNRLEKYRADTEIWLKANHVRYDKLYMQQFKNKEERIKAANYGKFKANVLTETKGVFFIESSLKQSIEISNLTGRSVYCVDEHKMINPNFIVLNKHRLLRRLFDLWSK